MCHLRNTLCRPVAVVAAILLASVMETVVGDEKADRLYAKQQLIHMRDIERRLSVTHKDRAEEMWYVLVYCDQAAQAEFVPRNPEARVGYWNYEVQRDLKYQIVKGRKAAAIAVEKFLTTTSETARRIDPAAYDNLTRWEKTWDFRAFRSAKEADAFYQHHKGVPKP